MNRTEYRRLRRTMRAWMHTKHQTIRFGDYADSQLVVQIQADAQTARDIQRRIDQIRQQLPSVGTDPRGMGALLLQQKHRRSHTVARVQRRQHDAEMVRRLARWAERTAQAKTCA